MRQDIATALEVVTDDGVIILDDYRTVPHALGVAAAAWEAVVDGRLVPVIATDQKLYGCPPGGPRTAKELLRWADEDAPFFGLRQRVAGHEAICFAPPPSPPVVSEDAVEREPSAAPTVDHAAEAADLRERLALIERSRTWRWRGKLVRFLRPFRGRA